uniref:Uncharacterized protein n=1 Tax=Glossina pallidipes TaxID=7398 RepID=A0A1A9Z5W4_GLOPL
MVCTGIQQQHLILLKAYYMSTLKSSKRNFKTIIEICLHNDSRVLLPMKFSIWNMPSSSCVRYGFIYEKTSPIILEDVQGNKKNVNSLQCRGCVANKTYFKYLTPYTCMANDINI